MSALPSLIEKLSALAGVVSQAIAAILALGSPEKADG